MSSGPLSVLMASSNPRTSRLDQDLGDVCALHGQVHCDVDPFMSEVIAHGQAHDASALGLRIADEVQIPGLIAASGGGSGINLIYDAAANQSSPSSP